MNEIYWVIGVIAVMVFCEGFYFEFLARRKDRLLNLASYRRQRLPEAFVLRMVGYDPFEIMKQVVSRAGVVSSELLVVKKSPSSARLFHIGKKATIVCRASFMARISEKEFEGVVAHEIGHVFENSLYRFTRCSIHGFFACGLFLWVAGILVLFGGSAGTGHLENVGFILVIMFLSACSSLLGRACIVASPILQKRTEFGADKKALSFTRYPQDFVGLLSKIEEWKDLYEREIALTGILPVKTKDTHPPMRKRIEAAKRILEKRGVAK